MKNVSSELIKEVFELKRKNLALLEKNKDLQEMIVKLSYESRKVRILETKYEKLERNVKEMLKDKEKRTTNRITYNLTKHYESIIRKQNARILELERALNIDDSNRDIMNKRIRKQIKSNKVN
jgi:hypothetical protein